VCRRGERSGRKKALVGAERGEVSRGVDGDYRSSLSLMGQIEIGGEMDVGSLDHENEHRRKGTEISWFP
jgi:hypothetical protein